MMNLCVRYSRGFGVVRYLLGEEHLLNVPNCVTGIVFYTLQFILGNHSNLMMTMMMMKKRAVYRTVRWKSMFHIPCRD